MRADYWAVPAEELLEELGATRRGLSAAEAEARLDEYGENRIRPARRGPLAEAALSQLGNPLLWLLFFGAVVAMAVGETTDAATVIAIMLLGSLMSMVQEERAGRALQKLRDRIALRCRAVRDGVELDVLATTIVPGDVIGLAAGSLVPADALVLEARDLYVSEAALTGEAFAVEKSPGTTRPDAPLAARSNVVHMGTNVRSGTGRALVVKTGAGTAFGGVAGRLVLRPPESSFQHGLRRFGYLLLSMMIVLVFVVFAAAALRHHRAVEALLFAVALAVGLAPEMLPAVLATMLSRGARRMGARGVLVRRLDAIENLGNMDVLCTDKTGTLTEGDIHLEAATSAGGDASERVLELAAWNARLQAGLPNPLDRAIIDAVATRDVPAVDKLDEIPFDFTRKRLSVLVRAPERGSLLVTKGAFDAVLAVCTNVRDAGGALAPLDAPARESLRARVLAFGNQGMRVLGVATRDWPADDALGAAAERDLTLEGLLTFRDPPKPDVDKTLADLLKLGVRVKIVSGDHHAVVRHLGGVVGLASHKVVRGSQLALLRDEAVWNLVEHVDLFAEVDPGQKERILVALKKTGHVVGFMGDGINDAPAMHAADVAISVDSATDVAREAADFVLLERDLATVREGIREGRATFANTLKYVLTTESANLGNMLSMAGAALFLPFLPLLAHQVLLNNLLSDIPSMTLSGDHVDSELTEQPQRWDIGFIRRFMIVFGLVSAAFDGVMFVTLRLAFRAGAPEFRTAWFAESLLTELFVLLVLRTRRRFWKSRPHVALLGSTLAIGALACALPISPLGRSLDFVALPLHVWGAVIAVAAGYVLSVEAVKQPLFRWLDRRSRAPAPHDHALWVR